MKKGFYRHQVWLASIFVLFATALSANAATITVNSSADAGGSCPGTNCTLRQAIVNAIAGDTIAFDARLSTITLTSDELVLSKNLTIIGQGANLLSIQRSTASGIPNFRIFRVATNTAVTISGLSITNGVGGFGAATNGNGGGLYNAGTVTITGCAIFGNRTDGDQEGGGLFNLTSSTMTVTNCALSNNIGQFGGAIYNLGTLTLTNSTLSGNFGSFHGGGVESNGGTTTIVNSTLASNNANVGGGVALDGGAVTLKNTLIALNGAPGGGPDISGTVSSQGFNLISNTSGATITGTTTGNRLNINPNLGMFLDNGGPTKTHALLSGSPAIDGGISTAGVTTDQRGFARPVDDPAITNATGGDGTDIGAFEVQADQLPGCASLPHVVGNTNDAGTDSLRAIMANVCSGTTITFAPSARGIINLTSGELLINKSLKITGPGANLLTIQRSSSASTNFRIFHINGNFNASISGLTISKGFAPGSLGGGISNDNGSIALDGVTVSGNTADIGAGVYTARAATITNSTISGNTVTGNIAGDGGGAIYNQGALNLVNSTLSTNTAQISGGGGQGGGIRNNAGTVSIASTTIAGNLADQGGGIYTSNGGSVTFQNSIIAQNTSTTGADLNGTFSSNGFNLIANSTGATLSPAQFSDQIGNSGSPLDPKLDILQDNGGPTFTRALLSGSPAIDKGNSNGLQKDQRGFPRSIDFSFIANASDGDGSDIGAFEVQPPTTLANISTRLRVETGDNALIGGFIVTGTQSKKVIIRGIGPSLGLGDQLANPTLELYSGQTLLKANDDWRNSSPADKQAIIDSTIPPTNDLESAIVATLPANGSGYTALLRGVNNGTGIGVIQIYDLDRSVDSKLANISTRGLVQTGDNVLFAGTIVLGQAPQKVIIRALGPSTGAPGAMADPTLQLVDSQGTQLAFNDNWRAGGQEAEIIATTIPPSSDAESAIVYNLPANGANYTAIVRGAGNTTGVAVVEVYALQ